MCDLYTWLIIPYIITLGYPLARYELGNRIYSQSVFLREKYTGKERIKSFSLSKFLSIIKIHELFSIFQVTGYSKIKMYKIIKEMEIPDHLTCLLRNLYASQEARVRTRHGTKDWFKIGKGCMSRLYIAPCLFNFYADYIV